MGPKVTVIGSINMDIVVRCPRLVKEGESLVGSDLKMIPGGKGANQAVAAAKLGAETSFVGRVGEDAFGMQLISSLKKWRVDTSHILKDNLVQTGTALITVFDNGNNAIVVVKGANDRVTKQDVDSAANIIKNSDILLLQLEIPLDVVAYAERKAKQSGVKVILDAGPAMECPDDILAGADIISPNETEAEAITGIKVDNIDSAKIAAESILERGAQEVVLKLGANGCLWANRNFFQHFPAIDIKAVDPTAAGDVFTSALAVRYASGDKMEDALQYANFAAAFSVTKFGAQPSAPDVAELEEFIRARS